MSSEATVGDYVTLQRGTTYKGNLVGQPGPALLGLGSITPGGGFREGDYKTYGGDCPPKLMLFPGDLFVSLKGATKDGKMIGSVARVPSSVPSGRLTQDTVKLELRDSNSETAKYLYWTLRTPEYRDYCDGRATGSAVVALSRDDFLGYPVPPVTTIRMGIVDLLETLDAKIELNRRMNATLEAMARALFQSWFVDFDPVRAKLDGRKPVGLDTATAALFPAKFQDSVLGSVPQGWDVAKVGDIAARIAMGPFGSRITRDNFVPDGVPVVRGGNLTDGFVDNDFVFLTENKADELKSAVARSLDLVFTHRGTLGQVGIIPYQARYPRYVVSQSQMLLSVDRRRVSPWMLYLFFKSPIGEDALLANTSTTGVPAISRPTTSLKAIPIVVPSAAVSECFNELVQPWFLQREQNARQSRTLATLRDTLLPKLLSGELQISPSN